MSGSQSGRAYIGSFTAAGGRGIVTARLDPEDGSLTLLDATDALPDPSYLTVAGPLLYAVSETRDGAVAAFRTDTTPAVLAAPPVPVDGAGPTHLAIWGDRVLTANYGSGSVSSLPLRADGTPYPAGRDVLRHTGSGPHPQRQQAPHAHQILPDPSGRWAVSVDLGTDSVRVCALSDEGGLVLHHETALRPGSGPRHLAFHPSGRYAYVLNELAPTLTVCRWDAVEGALRPLTELPVLPDGSARGDAFPSEVVVAPDGRFLWTATRGEDVVTTFALDATGEAITLVGTVSCGGRWPRDLAIDPSNRFLYAANERSGDVTWFAVDQESGLPVRGGSVRVPAPSCVVFG
ncbi:beta-propeller fold lactonase family protein [Streptomyces sp. SID8379]|uniref:lactonase family protein n=1 Tax=unclassified Streptomyces TaxID=2593676 RepID=UPI00036EF01F|nr:lactonase family protein [Streptomyces sp. HmicA12]MYW63021.1 beta-propeller fold lactonase family protein [Streptomyces sp. SID8379]